jgi:hypothetical protein
MLIDFFDAAHYQGLTIPGWPAVLSHIDRARAGDITNAMWPPVELHEFMAIAQHHGIPTRLLDWSLDPLVAAYFAAMADPSTSAAPTMAVWILGRLLYRQDPILELHVRISNPIVVPYDLNRNAHAQRGVFTLHLPCFDSAAPGSKDAVPSAEPLDTFLSRCSIEDPPNGLRKVTLPRTETANLLRLLDRRRISGSTMFPGYDGAARGAKERSIWLR